MRRVHRFIRNVRWLYRHGLLNRHNLRAMWIQSTPGWPDRLAFEGSDEEARAFIRALEE